MEPFERQLKKHLYTKPQSAIAIYPAGFGETALNEINEIINHPWFPQKHQGQISLLKNEIRIDKIHCFALVELMLRTQCLTDLRLIIHESKAFGKSIFAKKCGEIAWDFYINKSMAIKIKVDSIASKAFHESSLKVILSNILQDKAKEIVSGDNTNEDTCIYIELVKNKLKISISFAGSPLYKRGYRSTISHNAPLREDIAAACIKQAFTFAHTFEPQFIPDTVVIPFSGSGTFAFETLLHTFQLAPALLNRAYAFQKMPLFRKEHFQYLIKKARENVKQSEPTCSLKITCIDQSDQANQSFRANLKQFNEILSGYQSSQITLHESNFFDLNITTIVPEHSGNLFIPLNPPYGIRLGKNRDSVLLYKKIASRLNEIISYSKAHQTRLLGFILCPDEETWSAFCKHLTAPNIMTYHCTQGGLDIRVCQFFV